MPKKLIMTVTSAMRGKYGAKGWSRVKGAVDRLIASDRVRGIETSLLALDEIEGSSVRRRDPESYKQAVDRLFEAHGRPDYLAILGGPDVIPHQPLINPAGDEDDRVPSDLPYACDAPAGDRAEAFVGTGRVVGRIPDLPGADDPTMLEAILDHSAAWVPRTEAEYKKYFGVSAAVWRKSTTLSLEAVFGKGAKPHTSPKKGPKWTRPELQPLSHFINCHGAPADPQFYGQKGIQYPVAHQASYLPRKIASGTVAAAECCYGAELYDPEGDTPPICTTYLQEGAIGFLGSTNIAYGPADSNAQADLICRFFVESVLRGASIGRALLEARQRYVQKASPLSPVDLKTLAQFLLLGDPSSRPIGQLTKPETKSFMRRVARHTVTRDHLMAKAIALDQGIGRVASRADEGASEAAGTELARAAAAAGLVAQGEVKTYSVQPLGGGAAGEGAMRKALPPVRFHLLFATPAEALAPTPVASPSHAGGGKKARRFRLPRIVTRIILLAREVGGKVVKVDRLYPHRSPTRHERRLRRRGDEKALRPRLEERARGRGAPHG